MLRKAENKDIPRIAEIIIFTKRVTYRPIFQNDNVSFNEMQVIKEIERMKQPHELDDVYVYDDGIVKATIKAVIDGDEIKVSDFLVDTFFQGEGIGTKILTEFMNKSPKVSLYVLDKNEKAIRFYDKLGFKYTGVKKEFLNSGFYMLQYVYVQK